MTTSRRIALSFGCVVFVIALLFALTITSMVIHGANRTELATPLEVAPLYLAVALPGWIIALPFVVQFKDAEGRRGWWMLLIGTVIGPAFIVGWCGIYWQHFPSSGDRFALVAAAVISFLTTASYVLSLRVLDRRNSISKGKDA